MSQDLLERIEGGIATLTMNRPEARNAMTRPMLIDLERSLARLAADRSVRLVVLTGTGDAFCAGGDVKGFAKSAADGVETVSFEERTQGLRMIMESARWLHEMPKPTLAVIPGPAAGAGLSLALACDMRIASSNAKFTTAFSKIGLSGDFGGSYFLNYLVGAAKAREMYFTAQAAQAWAGELVALPTVAVGYMKQNLNSALRGSLGDVLDLEAPNMIRTFETQDHKGAALAFVEKRPPQFKGC